MESLSTMVRVAQTQAHGHKRARQRRHVVVPGWPSSLARGVISKDPRSMHTLPARLHAMDAWENAPLTQRLANALLGQSMRTAPQTPSAQPKVRTA